MSVNDASRIIIDDTRVTLQILASLTDDSRVIIYDYNMLIVQATSIVWLKMLLLGSISRLFIVALIIKSSKTI